MCAGYAIASALPGERVSYGVSSMTATLRRVALRHPGQSLFQADPQTWHYGPTFDAKTATAEHAAFARLLEQQGVEILWLEGDDRGNADAVFTYDASLVTPAGAILMNPGKPLRSGEQVLHRDFYRAVDIPIIGEIGGDGRAEAGDTLWLDDHVLAVGRGFRTNPEALGQLATLLSPSGIAVHGFDLPVYHGAAACLHLMSLLSLVDTRKAAIVRPLLPVGLYRLLLELEYDLIELPADEFERSGGLSANLLAISPGHCVMIEGYPATRSLLKNSGIQVSAFPGDSLCIGCEGGPTCLSRPILRRNEGE